jgi:hypothetical protein
MANVIAKSIRELLLRQTLRPAQIRKLSPNRLGQRAVLSLPVCTDSFGHPPMFWRLTPIDSVTIVRQ